MTVKAQATSSQDRKKQTASARDKALRLALQNPETIQAIRANNLKIVCNTVGGPTEVGKKLGHKNPAARLNHLIGPNPIRPVGDTTARKIEQVFSLEPYWMDKPHALVEPITLNSPQLKKTPSQLANVDWTMSVMRGCLEILEAQALKPSLAKFTDLVELALIASAENSGEFNKTRIQQMLKLMS